MKISKTKNNDLTPLAEQPAYNLTQAARYIDLAPATLRSWVLGRTYPTTRGASKFEPLITLADPELNLLSFNNLIEVHVLRSLRNEHGVTIEAVRDALAFAEEKLGRKRLLLSEDLMTAGGKLFLEEYGRLLNLSPSRQMLLDEVFRHYLRRIEWQDTIPARLYPLKPLPPIENLDRLVMIDPRFQFGHPAIARHPVSTQVIVERIDSGESIEGLVADYDLSPNEIKAAIFYEKAA